MTDMIESARVLRNSLIIDKAAPDGFLPVVRSDKTRELLDIAIGCMEPESDYIFTMHQDEQVDDSHVMIVNTLSFKPLVRCRDCKHYKPDPSPIDPGWPMLCEDTGRDMVEPDGFCAWGEVRVGSSEVRVEVAGEEEVAE